jgi:ATP-dependent DNA helicase DinG
MPSRLLAAFPPGVPIARVTLDEAVERVASRLSSGAPIGHGGIPQPLTETP